MDFYYYKHSDAPIGRTIKTSKALADMTPSDHADLEAVASDLETATGQPVWTIDINLADIGPRGGRPVS